jgi:uncharacterized membrane protein YbaN (DUF454 family)
MDKAEQIKAAIDSLPHEEFWLLAEWFRERQQRRWDEQLDSDSVSGKLNFLFEEGSRTPR